MGTANFTDALSEEKHLAISVLRPLLIGHILDVILVVLSNLRKNMKETVFDKLQSNLI